MVMDNLHRTRARLYYGDGGPKGVEECWKFSEEDLSPEVGLDSANCLVVEQR